MSKCLNPTEAWICGYKCAKDGVLSPHVVFSPTDAMRYYERIGCLYLMDSNKVAVPCGRCINCQMQKRKDMSVRLAHEASQHENCCFLTLTYNDDNVPTTDWNAIGCPRKQFDNGLGSLPSLTLFPRDVQLFMKRLRRRLEYHYGVKGIRYFAVGEYGGRTHRPHYHVLIFGWCPTDLVYHKMHKGNVVYRSSLIEDLWTTIDRADPSKRVSLGYSSVSEVTPFVAKYAARYVTKKYARLLDDDGNYIVPEFTLQSVRNGGIGATWFDKFGEHACRVGLCTLRCSNDRIYKHTIPQYYWHRLRKQNIPLWVVLRDQRIEFVKRHPSSPDFHELCNIAACAVEQVKHEKQVEVIGNETL